MMQARMTNPVMVLPDAMKALLALGRRRSRAPFP